MRFLRTVFYSFVLLVTYHVEAQKIETKDIEIVGEEVQLTFQITPDHSLRERYSVSIYASHDDYAVPLNVSISEIAPNELTEVSFSIIETIGYFQGQLQFRLEAQATTFPVKVLSSTSQKFRKNKNYEINWEDHNGLEAYDIHLHHQDTIITLAQAVTGNSYSDRFPKTINPGKFHIAVSPTINPELGSDHFPIMVKRNVTTLIALTAVLAGGTGFLLLNGGGESPGGGELPDPPGTPN